MRLSWDSRIDPYRLKTSRVKKTKIRFGKSSPRSPHEHPILGIYEDVIQPPTMRRGTFLTVESCLPQSFKDASNESVRFDRTIQLKYLIYFFICLKIFKIFLTYSVISKRYDLKLIYDQALSFINFFNYDPFWINL